MTDRTDSPEFPSFSVNDMSSSTSTSTSTSTSILFQATNAKKDNDNGNFEKMKKYFIKLQKIALEASEQSERLTVPRVSIFNVHQDSTTLPNSNICNVTNLLLYWERHFRNSNDARILLVCRERDAPNSMNVLQALQPSLHCKESKDSYAFLIGPEGGWSLEEEIILDKYALDFPSIIKSVALGENKQMILRAETAAIMAIGSWSLTHGFYEI